MSARRSGESPFRLVGWGPRESRRERQLLARLRQQVDNEVEAIERSQLNLRQNQTGSREAPDPDERLGASEEGAGRDDRSERDEVEISRGDIEHRSGDTTRKSRERPSPDSRGREEGDTAIPRSARRRVRRGGRIWRGQVQDSGTSEADRAAPWHDERSRDQDDRLDPPSR